MTRIDPELGPMRRCRRCLDWWPEDDEFYGPRAAGYLRWTCRACRAELERGIEPPQRVVPDAEREAEREARLARQREQNRAHCRAYYWRNAEQQRQRKRDARVAA